MRLARLLLSVVVLLGGVSAAAATEPAALARARTLYNQADYEGAINAALVAQQEPPWADAAALVIARAHLERYRAGANPADLAQARETLRAVRADALTPRDQVDLVIGLGQALYLGELFGAAAELFETALSQSVLIGDHDRLMLLDWWATALDREAQTRPLDGRPRLFERIGSRMEIELRDDAANPVANYWLAVAARGTGDVDRAWNAAIAAWLRSGLRPESAEKLRTDIDRLVTQALVAERARVHPAAEQQQAAAGMRAEWARVKEQWK
jgi:hypothetical protein